METGTPEPVKCKPLTRLQFDERLRHLRKNHWGVLVRIASKTGVRAQDIDDVFQEASLRAWVNSTNYCPDRPFKNWFVVVYRNVAIDWLRGRYVPRYSTMVPCGDAEKVHDTASRVRGTEEALTEGPEQGAINRETAAALLSLLSEEEQKVVLLHFGYDLTYAEVAKRLSIRASRALYLVKRIRQRVRGSEQCQLLQ